MTTSRTVALGSLVLWGVAAMLCGCAEAARTDRTLVGASSADSSPDGRILNGRILNGRILNGISLNGISLNGNTLDGVSLQGGALVAAGDVDLTGALLTGTLSDGSTITLRIDAVRPSSDADITLYAVSYRELQDGSPWGPLCTDAEGSPVTAFPLAGTWNYAEGIPGGGSHDDVAGTFTFACEGHALAECVGLGFAPWRHVSECRAPGDCHVLSLASFHQTCTRMLRADYCGDGTSMTRDGTVIDVWDAFGIQSDTDPHWRFEAEWTTEGAACVTRPRWPIVAPGGLPTRTYILEHCPSRWRVEGCGGPDSTFFTPNGFAVPLDTRSLLRDRVAPDQP
jgi:hypothetical protein